MKSTFRCISSVSIYFILIGFGLLSLVGCLNNTDDPTNIEHEVLRASLLEKELKIDELLKTIDQTSNKLAQLEDLNNELKKDYQRSQDNLSILMNTKDIEFNIDNTKDNFFQSVNDKLYITGVYDNKDLEIRQEILFLLQKGDSKKELYRGKDISFFVDPTNLSIQLLDENNLYILDESGTIKYKADIDLNNPQVDLHSNLIISKSKKINTAVVLLTKDSSFPSDATSNDPEKEISRLMAVIYFDLLDLSNVKQTTYLFDTSQYICFADEGKVIYVKIKDDEQMLEVLDLRTEEINLIHTNKIESLELRYENNVLYYNNDEGLENAYLP